jgi:hypothetical protein
MGLFAAIVVALLLTFVTVVMRPAALMAADGQRPSQPPSGQSTSNLTPGAPARAERATGGTGMPKLGKASNPYDMKALRNFDAGSHQ